MRYGYPMNDFRSPRPPIALRPDDSAARARVVAQPRADLFDVEDTLLRIAEDPRYRAIGLVTAVVLLALTTVRLAPLALELSQRPIQALYATGEHDPLALERARAMAAAAPGSPAARGLLGDDFWDELKRLSGS